MKKIKKKMFKRMCPWIKKTMFFKLVTVSLMMVTMTQAYSGDATFYGAGGAGEQGACMLPRNFNGVQNTAALNPYQFENGQACGKCVLVRGDGRGSGMTPVIGPLYATIDNLCPECKHGDIDLGLQGDGRFLVDWEFVDCAQVPKIRTRSLRGTVDIPDVPDVPDVPGNIF
jgi:hypothetical protein